MSEDFLFGVLVGIAGYTLGLLLRQRWRRQRELFDEDVLRRLREGGRL